MSLCWLLLPGSCHLSGTGPRSRCPAECFSSCRHPVCSGREALWESRGTETGLSPGHRGRY